MSIDLTELAEVRSVTIDEYSLVRQLHASAIRSFAADQLAIDEVDALLEHIHSPEYTDRIHSSNTLGAWIEGELAATCGWSAADDTGHTARIVHLHVSPLFSGGGLGRLMLSLAEDAAMSAGFMQLGVRAIASGAPFLTHMGYEVTSHGVQPLPQGVSVPVVFLRKGPYLNASIRRPLRDLRAAVHHVTVN
jgi:putative acetyltransferase